MKDEDRFLQQRGGRWHYKRNVPNDIAAAGLDKRAPRVRIALKTKSILAARELRDRHERADDALWAALRLGKDAATARQEYEASLSIQRAADLPPLDFAAIVEELKRHTDARGNIDMGAANRAAGVYDRMTALEATGANLDAPDSPALAAAFGLAPRPAMTVREAFDAYLEDMKTGEWLQKSPGQIKQAERIKRRAVDAFCAVVANKAIEDIDREDALKFHRYWKNRMATEGLTFSTAARDLDNMRVLARHYHAMKGDHDGRTVFDGLSFKKPRSVARRNSFTVDHVCSVFLSGDGLAGLGDEARRALIAIIWTGCRPSEILNLRPENIHLAAPVPFIEIKDRADRELKTPWSNRQIPLIGGALDALKAQKNGFNRYADKETNFSAAVMKYIKENKLRSDEAQTVYSFRHTFEDLLKDAGVDTEMRAMLMGHRLERVQYGRGFTLEAKRDAMTAALAAYAVSYFA